MIEKTCNLWLSHIGKTILVLINWFPIELFPVYFIGGILSHHLLEKISLEIEWTFQALDEDDFSLYELFFLYCTRFYDFSLINL